MNRWTVSRGILPLLLLVMLACGEPAPQIDVFGQTISLASEVRQLEHDRGFLDVIGVEELHYNAARELSSDQMLEVATALAGAAGIPLPEGEVRLAYVFSGDPYGSTGTIEPADVHGFSLFSSAGGRLTHHYFEADANGYAEVTSLTREIQGSFSFDDVRMLHFAASGETGLPGRSTIFEFRGEAQTEEPDPATDRGVRLALLLDNSRFWGAPTSGLYGEEIQAALMAPQNPGGGGRFCGLVNPGPPLVSEPTDPDSGCPVGADPCYQDPRAGTKMFCTRKDTGCFSAMTSELVAAGREDDASTIDFPRLWAFQDDFLLRYPIGRDYVAAYLVISLFLEMDEAAMQKSIDIMPHAYQAMDLLLSGDDGETVVTEDFFSMTSDLIESVRIPENPVYERVLDRLQRDLEDFRGLSRAELVNQFETRRSTSLASAIID